MKKKIKMAFYKFFKSKVSYVFFILLFLAVIIAVSFAQNKDEFDIGKFFRFDMVLSISITGFIGLLIALIIKIIERHLEDSIKIEDKFDELNKIYCHENFIIHNNGEKEITVPVAYMYKLSENVEIEYTSRCSDYSLPYVCKSNFQTLFSAHKYSAVANSEVSRLHDIKYENNKLTLDLQNTNFFNGLVTNRACDYDIGNRLTLRKIFEYKSKFTPLSKSHLSNHLGINGFVFTSDGKMIFIYRNGKKSIAKFKWGNSFGHPLFAEDASKVTREYVENQMFEKIALRYHLKAEHIKNCRPIAVVRTSTEAGKPSLVYNVQLNLTVSEFFSEIEKACGKKPAKKFNKNVKAFLPQQIKILSPDSFSVDGKIYSTTIDGVAAILICAGQGRERNDNLRENA